MCTNLKVEIHKSKGYYYMLDLGRFLPSNVFKNMYAYFKDPTSPFVNLFRGEPLKRDTDLEISCDAFSGFGRIDREIWNNKSLQFIENSIEDMENRLERLLLSPEIEITQENICSSS